MKRIIGTTIAGVIAALFAPALAGTAFANTCTASVVPQSAPNNVCASASPNTSNPALSQASVTDTFSAAGATGGGYASYNGTQGVTANPNFAECLSHAGDTACIFSVHNGSVGGQVSGLVGACIALDASTLGCADGNGHALWVGGVSIF